MFVILFLILRIVFFL